MISDYELYEIVMADFPDLGRCEGVIVHMMGDAVILESVVPHFNKITTHEFLSKDLFKIVTTMGTPTSPMGLTGIVKPDDMYGLMRKYLKERGYIKNK